MKGAISRGALRKGVLAFVREDVTETVRFFSPSGVEGTGIHDALLLLKSFSERNVKLLRLTRDE